MPNFVLENMKEACVKVDCISASWSGDQESLVLSDVSFKVDKVSEWLWCVIVNDNHCM